MKTLTLLTIALLSTFSLLPALALAGEPLPPRSSGKYGKNVPPEPIDTPLKHPKDPALWWQGITDDDVYHPEWALSSRAAVVDASTQISASTAQSAHKKNNKDKKKKKKKKKGYGLSGHWKKYGCGRVVNEGKKGGEGKKETWGRSRAKYKCHPKLW
ncbi:hypothetical protein COCVIDRAFT_37988 [Bipolaris victoriae FI3]|uniref:Uncharacterized protein n=1 Tax=Bipolaris victoriae (strain FI3) TaxID=930091 RepID=W7ESF0_BIPV3|nr:hypothetical protein COCVIDRAFT_37988 [Bipolaris victoriae FI3]